MTALSGITVVDVSGSIGTSYCAKLFADYGATVINLEPGTGFKTRTEPPFTPDGPDGETSALHAYLNTNKHSVVIDKLTHTQLGTLFDQADLILDDTNPIIEPPADSSRMTISWYGETGPMANFVGTDAQMYAMNGMLRMIGKPDAAPYIPTGYQAQIVGGATAFIGAMGQVLSRELGNIGKAQQLETSILESVMCFTDVGVISAHNTGIESSRMGVNRFPPTYPLGVFPCNDGWLGVTVLTPSQWHAFCELLDLQDLAEVPLFQSSVGRLEARDIIEPRFTEQLLKHSAEDLFYRGQNARIPLARVPTMEELFLVDQFVKRDAFCNADLGHTKLTVPSTPFRLYATPPTFGGPVATLGEHTETYTHG
ncbi:MAG: hypothetical protein GKR90_09345 [Pseudomonadales bacterium]|nr:hypothetical protein [Pseudomonadales bacterium]